MKTMDDLFATALELSRAVSRARMWSERRTIISIEWDHTESQWDARMMAATEEHGSYWEIVGQTYAVSAAEALLSLVEALRQELSQPEEPTPPPDTRSAYERLMEAYRKELGDG